MTPLDPVVINRRGVCEGRRRYEIPGGERAGGKYTRYAAKARGWRPIQDRYAPYDLRRSPGPSSECFKMGWIADVVMPGQAIQSAPAFSLANLFAAHCPP